MIAKLDNRINLGNYAIQDDIFTPERSGELAEFVGIVLGDGGITDRQLKITVDSEKDAEYIPFITNLIVRLFKLTPSLRLRVPRRAIDIVVSKTKLSTFLNSIGLRSGNKTLQQVDIPDWIKENTEYSTSCIRGLMDTDGCIYSERHTIKNKIYSYPRISIVNRSIPLLQSVYKILISLGFKAKIRGNRCVMLENREDVIRYFNEVGSNNPKHRNRFLEFTTVIPDLIPA